MYSSVQGPSTNRIDAFGRAQQLMWASGENLPRIAMEFAKELCTLQSYCMEVVFQAYVFYAQLAEGYSCKYEWYVPANDVKALFLKVKNALN